MKVMGSLPGFVDYYAFDGVVASISVFAYRSGLEEAERRLAEWIERTVAQLDISPGQGSEGEVCATSRPGA